MMKTDDFFCLWLASLHMLSTCHGFVIPVTHVPLHFSAPFCADLHSSSTALGVLGDLWNELLEFSTLGPGERKLLQARRRDAAAEITCDDADECGVGTPNNDVLGLEAFRAAKQKFDSCKTASTKENARRVKAATPTTTSYDRVDLSLDAFQAAVNALSSGSVDSSYSEWDGYALRELLVCKWDAPLDICFQRQPNSVYCTVLPVAFGSSKCQHVTELDYLMHLQATVEILRQYRNLDGFVANVETTSQMPKPGTSAVPYRLVLQPEELQQILG